MKVSKSPPNTNCPIKNNTISAIEIGNILKIPMRQNLGEYAWKKIISHFIKNSAWMLSIIESEKDYLNFNLQNV